jgi:cytoskeletal protein RodZ
MQPATLNQKRQILTTLAVLLIIVAIVAAVTVTNKKQTNMKNISSVTADATSQTTASSSSGASPSQTSSSSTFKDGTYAATGLYDSPAGTESITVTVTLANDVVTATSANSGANDPEAREYQSMFISGYKQQVVGKRISDISLSRVSGSSLTSQGFNSAIQKIESQAKA